MSEGIKDMSQNQFNRNCSSVFDTDKLAACVGRMFLSAVGKDLGGIGDSPFVKHIFWHSGANDDVFSLDRDLRCVWISSFTAELRGSYNITISGIIKLKSASRSKIRIRPVLYQADVDGGFDKRSAITDFDVECDVQKGISVIPFSSVIKFRCSCGNNPPKLGFVIMASGAGDITGFSYTISGVPSCSPHGVEVLNVQGLVCDYRDETETPLFLIKYPPDKAAEQEDFYE